MMASPSIDNRAHTNRSRRRSASNAPTCARSPVLHARPSHASLPKPAPARQSPCAPAKRVPKPLQSKLIKPVAAAKSP